MKFHAFLPMLALGLAGPAMALPLTPQTPVTISIEVKCYFFEGHRQTVDIIMDRRMMVSPSLLLHFDFRNVQSGQSIGFLRGVPGETQRFGIPTGTYTVTISYAHAAGSSGPPGTLELRHNQSVIRNLRVPVVVSTGGRGTGCDFAP